MWIVRIALQRPYTFIVMALLLLIISPIVILRTPTDIFPNINIPIVSVIWSFVGLNPEEMEGRIVSIHERVMTTTVNDIEHIESQTLSGVAVIKIFFHPTARIDTAIAQVTAVSQSILRFLPPGITPPLILSYNASSVPILQLGLSSETLSEQELNDYGANFIRLQLATVQGASVPLPFGGKPRQMMIDIDPAALEAKGLSPLDIVNAVNAQNLILPAGTSKIGQFEYDVDINASPKTAEEISYLPVKVVGNTTIYIRDVAHVRDGFAPQTNVVRQDGQRGSLLFVMKTGNASTLDIVRRVRETLPRIAAGLPPQLKIQPLADQSLFVRAAVDGVIKEAIIAAVLTGLMILMFIGSWRSTLIIGLSIPLSILASIVVFSALGETINIMTLGGLALAVGILVDDATVTIENIDRHLSQGKDLKTGILDGAAQIAVPAFVSTLSICIVFIPVFFLTGVSRYLFVPLAEAVAFAMIASYILSRTLVPTLAMYLLKTRESRHDPAHRSFFGRVQQAFERGFERSRESYRRRLASCIRHRRVFIVAFLVACLSAFLLVPWLGEDFFPSTDSGRFTLHLRAKTGTRIEETARLCDLVETSIRRLIPPDELSNVIDNIGLPSSGINLSYSNSAPIGAADADILVSLREKHCPTDQYLRDLRLRLREEFPGVTFYFLPADIVSQILNFGLPAPIDIQVVGRNIEANHQFAIQLLGRLRQIPGAVDLRIQQMFDRPRMHVVVDRTKAREIGFTQREIASSMLISLSGSFQTSPTFWLDPKNGVSYNLVTQMPQYNLASLQDLQSIPITGQNQLRPEILGSLATVTRSAEMAVVSHYNVQRVIDIFGSVQGRDLGGVAQDITRVVNESQKDLPPGSQLIVRGQIETMRSSFLGLLGGLVFSVVLVYLLIVVNFQSWLDPFIIITALPAALAGILVCLFVTNTTVSVPALMGSIMCMGVATANSILVVSFAKDRISQHGNATSAALEAGFTRFRPVLMTALAMIIGMVPMALGLGEGGEQNAPLGRAVIGGLILATVATLFFVPAVFSLLHGFRKFAPISNETDWRHE